HLLAHRQRGTRSTAGIHTVVVGHAGMGEVPHRGGDLGCNALPVRLHRAQASRPGGDGMMGHGRMRGMLVSTILATVLLPLPAVAQSEPNLGTEQQREAGRVLYLEK